MSSTDEFSAEALRSAPRFMDRLLPPRSFRRAATITGACILSLGGIIHYEVGRLQDSQESGINGVRTEVANQGAGIKDPLLVKLDEAGKTIEEGKAQLEICKDVANKLGITPSEQPSVEESDQAAAIPADSTTTTTTVAVAP